jgi:hypothetical protein
LHDRRGACGGQSLPRLRGTLHCGIYQLNNARVLFEMEFLLVSLFLLVYLFY